MKKIILAIGVLVFLSITNPCSGSEKDLNLLSKFDVKIGGELTTMAKVQNSYGTSLDRPDWDWNWRSGANHRNDQNFRVRGSVHVYAGKPGETAWFLFTQIKFDANNPDEADTIMSDDSGTWDDSDYSIDVGNAFVMYRPFKLNGGRPFGITLGQQTIKATANAAYSNQFIGDFEDDFFMYTAAALTDVPAITLDFHIDADTGVGFTYAKGCSDISKAGGGVKSEGADTYVAWLEAKRWNIGLNSAFQSVSGHRAANDVHVTDAGNEVLKYRHKYTHYLFNILASYTIGTDFMTLKPFVGFNRVWGDQSPIVALEAAGFDNREIEGDITTLGFTLDYMISKLPLKFAFEFSDVSIDDFDGIGGLEKGAVSMYAMAADALPPAEGGGYTAALGNHSWSNKPVSGFSKNIFNAGGVDWAMHLEQAADITSKIKVGIFYNYLKAEKQKIDDDEYERQQIIAGLAEKFESESDADLTLATGVATALVNAWAAAPSTTADSILDELLIKNNYAEWEDTYSCGIYVKYSF